MTGIRFIFDSKAKGKTLVFEVFVLQIATLLASLCIVYHIGDFIARNFFKSNVLFFFCLTFRWRKNQPKEIYNPI